MFDRKSLAKVAVTVFVLSMVVLLISPGSSAQQKPSESEKALAKAAWPKDVNRDSGYRLPATFARANKIYGAPKLVNIVGLMGFYSTAAAELQTFGFEMPAGEKSTLPVEGR